MLLGVPFWAWSMINPRITRAAYPMNRARWETTGRRAQPCPGTLCAEGLGAHGHLSRVVRVHAWRADATGIESGKHASAAGPSPVSAATISEEIAEPTSASRAAGHRLTAPRNGDTSRRSIDSQAARQTDQKERTPARTPAIALHFSSQRPPRSTRILRGWNACRLARSRMNTGDFATGKIGVCTS